MNRTPIKSHVRQVRRWVIGSAAFVLLLSAAGLTLAAQHARDQGDLVSVLLALHLAAWVYVLGLVGLVVLPVWQLIDWVRMRGAPMSSEHPAEPALGQIEMSGTQSDYDTPFVPSRSGRRRDERRTAKTSARVA